MSNEEKKEIFQRLQRFLCGIIIVRAFDRNSIMLIMYSAADIWEEIASQQ
jgi:hypothetical protein